MGLVAGTRLGASPVGATVPIRAKPFLLFREATWGFGASPLGTPWRREHSAPPPRSGSPVAKRVNSAQYSNRSPGSGGAIAGAFRRLLTCSYPYAILRIVKSVLCLPKNWMPIGRFSSVYPPGTITDGRPV